MCAYLSSPGGLSKCILVFQINCRPFKLWMPGRPNQLFPPIAHRSYCPAGVNHRFTYVQWYDRVAFQHGCPGSKNVPLSVYLIWRNHTGEDLYWIIHRFGTAPHFSLWGTWDGRCNTSSLFYFVFPFGLPDIYEPSFSVQILATFERFPLHYLLVWSSLIFDSAISELCIFV